MPRYRGSLLDLQYGPMPGLELLISLGLAECFDRAVEDAAIEPDPERDLPTEYRTVDGWGKSDEEYARPHRFS